MAHGPCVRSVRSELSGDYWLLDLAPHLDAANQNGDDRALWANIHFLFWLSLTPAVTAWFGTDIYAVPAAVLFQLNVIIAPPLLFVGLGINSLVWLIPTTKNMRLVTAPRDGTHE